MKTALFYCIALFLINSNQQRKPYYFLNITTYNQSEKATKGKFIYQITDKHLAIINSKATRFQDQVLLFKKMDDKAIARLQKINLYTLEKQYNNKCIEAATGVEYTISVEDEVNDNEISIHQYYNPTIAALITELNLHIPKKLKLYYLSPTTKQDCN